MTSIRSDYGVVDSTLKCEIAYSRRVERSIGATRELRSTLDSCFSDVWYETVSVDYSIRVQSFRFVMTAVV